MTSYEVARLKLNNNQLIKTHVSAKVKSRTTLTITKETFKDKEFPQELLLTTRQKS